MNYLIKSSLLGALCALSLASYAGSGTNFAVPLTKHEMAPAEKEPSNTEAFHSVVLKSENDKATAMEKKPGNTESVDALAMPFHSEKDKAKPMEKKPGNTESTTTGGANRPLTMPKF